MCVLFHYFWSEIHTGCWFLKFAKFLFQHSSSKADPHVSLAWALSVLEEGRLAMPQEQAGISSTLLHSNMDMN